MGLIQPYVLALWKLYVFNGIFEVIRKGGK